MEIKNLKRRVIAIMAVYPETRDSDVELTTRLWREYHRNALTVDAAGNLLVRLDALAELPREDNVKRVRAHVQNDLGRYLPTTIEVARKRKISEERWRAAIGSATEHLRM